MVKPFFLRVHPDVQASSNAKEVNLVAIQNLNAFLDSVENRLKKSSGKVLRNQTTLFEVDFCILMEERIKNKKEDILCRRKVELSIPPNQEGENKHRFQHIIETQLVKLLHVAGLKAPETVKMEESTDLEDQINRAWDLALKDGDFSRLNPAQIRLARQQKYLRNRDAFVSKINWDRYDEVYQASLRDTQGDKLTQGLIRSNPRRRMNYLSDILSKMSVQELQDENGETQHVDPIMQLIALRRLSLLLDEHFDTLQLEDLGRMWERTVFVLLPSRDYNTSASALYKRRKRRVKGDVMANDGFAFVLHHDNSVTIQLPVDFRDDEILSQLKRHVQDYQSLIDLGLDDGIFPATIRTNSSTSDELV